jgi:hypothetical protein
VRASGRESSLKKGKPQKGFLQAMRYMALNGMLTVNGTFLEMDGVMKGFMAALRHSLIRIVFCSAFISTVIVPQAWAQAQTTPLTPTAKKQMDEAAKQGFPLKTATVGANVSVDAVLLPASVASKVFGKEIAKNYATIELTISNRSRDAGLIVHTIIIDYKDWLLSGYEPADERCSPEGRLKPSETKPSEGREAENPCPSWQSQNSPNQIASVEYRVARGQLLDTQPWTWRNGIIRGLQAAGSIATAYSFTISGTHAVRSISAFTGQVVPALETFWPDSTIGQMNRISDFGFQVNKVIPKDSSDIIVAFFPIDRFLTPGLKKLFLKSPALFFSPYAMMLDPTARKLLEPITKSLFPSQDLMKNFIPHLAQNLTESKFATDNERKTQTDNEAKSPLTEAERQLKDFLSGVSLNRVHIIVGGTMTVDVDNVAARIDSIEIDNADATPSIWEQKGTVTGVITGSYLSGGTPNILEAGKVGISNVVAVAEGSTDSALHFKMTLAKTIPTDQILTFTVKKTDKQNRSIVSPPYQFSVTYTPTVSKDAASGGTSSTTSADNGKSQTTTSKTPESPLPEMTNAPPIKKKPN